MYSRFNQLAYKNNTKIKWVKTSQYLLEKFAGEKLLDNKEPGRLLNFS